MLVPLLSPLSPFLAIGMPGMTEWVIILVIALLLFGRRLPEVMRGLGGGVREFRKGIDGEPEDPPRTSASANVPPAVPPASPSQSDAGDTKASTSDKH